MKKKLYETENFSLWIIIVKFKTKLCQTKKVWHRRAQIEKETQGIEIKRMMKCDGRKRKEVKWGNIEMKTPSTFWNKLLLSLLSKLGMVHFPFSIRCGKWEISVLMKSKGLNPWWCAVAATRLIWPGGSQRLMPGF